MLSLINGPKLSSEEWLSKEVGAESKMTKQLNNV